MVGLSQQTLAEIQKKALAGTPLVKSDPQKNALYDYYRSNPAAQVGSGLSANTIQETLRKAQSGTQLVNPTGEKSALYNSVLGGGQQATAPKPAQSALSAPSLSTGMADNFFNNRIQAPQPNAPSVMNNGMMGSTTYDNSNYNSNQSRPDFLGMTPDMIQQIMSGMQGSGQYYDPSKDPVYQSMLELSSKQADKAGLQAMETMNDRGILNSTVTADRIGQIKQGASDAVLSSIPGLASNFDNKQLANSQSMQNLLNSVINAGQFQQTFGEDNRRFDAGFEEDARRFDKNFTLDEAKVTGRYIPQEAQGLINTVLEAKQASAQGGISPEQRAENNARANEARRILATMGVDISGLDSNIGYNDAVRNTANVGRNTLMQQEMDLARSEVMGTQQNTQAQGLIDQILRAKQASAQGGLTAEQRSYNQQTAQNARNQLAALGYDVSQLGGNVGYDQALKNISSMAPQTLKAISEEEGRKLDREKMAFEKTAFDREMNYKEQSALIDADLKARGLDLEEARISISRFTAESDADYRQYQKELGISEQQADKNTNAAIGEVSKARTPAEAVEFIADSASNWAQSGVDMRAVLKALEQLFPGTGEAVGAASGGGSRYGTGVP